MKKCFSIILTAALLLGVLPQIALADYTYGAADLINMATAATVLFDGEGNSGYSDTAFSASASIGVDWSAWASEYDNSFNLITVGGVDYFQCYKNGAAGGSDITIPASVASGAAAADFTIIEWTPSASANYHVVTFYDASDSTGSTVLKFKYASDGIYPCTVAAQNSDTYGAAIPYIAGETRVRVYLINEGESSRVVYATDYDGGFSPKYEVETTNAITNGLGCMRAYVGYAAKYANTRYGNLKISSGSFSNVDSGEASETFSLLNAGNSGAASGTGVFVATGVYPDAVGTPDHAPYISGDTGTHLTNLGSTRIGVMEFDATGDGDALINATLHVYVNSVNGNLGAGWTRVAAYETENPSLSYSLGSMNEALFHAKNYDYTYSAAMWSRDYFTNSGTDGLTSGWTTIDVTRAVRHALYDGSSVMLRFEVPTAGLNLSTDGEYAPYIEAAFGGEIYTALTLSGECSETVTTLPQTVTGFSGSSVTWSSDSAAVTISGGSISYNKTAAAQRATLHALITCGSAAYEKDFEITVHAQDSAPVAFERVFSASGIGYAAATGINLLDSATFDYTCDSISGAGWSAGGGALSASDFTVTEGYDSCGAIYAISSGSSGGANAVNPYIPLPEHDGSEAFILTFAAYSINNNSGGIEWSSVRLYGDNYAESTFVSGTLTNGNYKYGVKASPEWTVNKIAFVPSASDKYIRPAVGWIAGFGIDSISIVAAQAVEVSVSERYIDAATAYDGEQTVIGASAVTTLLLGETYSPNPPDEITYSGKTYIRTSNIIDRAVSVANGEDNGVMVLTYRYIDKDNSFRHAGLLNTDEDLSRIAGAIANGEEPYLSGYNALTSSTYSTAGVSARAVGTIVRSSESGSNYALLYTDAARAYQCALVYRLSGSTAHGDTARDIINAWSATLKTVTGSADRYLASGLYGYEMAIAAELIRDYPGFEIDRAQDMLYYVFYKPLCERFLYSNEYGGDHNGATIMNYWANWDLCNMAASEAIGIFCDRRDIYERALEYYKSGPGNGGIYNLVPYYFEDEGVGQWQEAGRDMGHTEMGVGLAAVCCEIAWNQGDDIYSWADSRLMRGAEYVAKYESGFFVPFETYQYHSGTSSSGWNYHTGISGRGDAREIWEMLYNHYAVRMGEDVPFITARARLVRPEGGPNSSHSSTFDQPGFGTLLYSRQPGEGKNNAAIPQSNIPEGVYRIVNRYSGKALAENNGAVVQYTAADDDSQKWELCDLGGGQYTVTNLSSGKSLTVSEGSFGNGEAIVTADYEGKAYQKFAFLRFEELYYGGYYRIAAAHSSKALDVLDWSNDDGASIIQYVYDTTSNQQWALEAIEEKEIGEPEIVRTYSGGFDAEVSARSDGGVFTAVAKIENDTASERKTLLYVAVYNADNSLKRLDVKVFDTEPGGGESAAVSIEYDASCGEFARAYIWSDDLCVYDTPAYSESARVAAVLSASSSGEGAEYAIDKDIATAWTVEGVSGESGAELIIELEEEAIVDSLGISFTDGDARMYTYSVYTSCDGVNYDATFTYKNSAETADMQYVSFYPARAKYVKIVLYGYNGKRNVTCGINEIKVLSCVK